MTELVLGVVLVERLKICLRYLYFIIELSGKNSVRIVLGANVIKSSISLFLISIRVTVLGLVKAVVGPTALLMLLLLSRIAAAYHLA